MLTVFTLQMLDQNEHNEWSHQSNRCKVLTGKHPHVAHSLSGLFPGENGPERQMGLSQEGCSLLCARLFSSNFHLAEFILGSHGDSEADGGRLRGFGVSHIPQGASWQGTSRALYLRRAKGRRTFKSPRCRDGGCRTQWPRTIEGVGQDEKKSTFNEETEQSEVRRQIPIPCKYAESAVEERSSNHGACRNFTDLV